MGSARLAIVAIFVVAPFAACIDQATPAATPESPSILHESGDPQTGSPASLTTPSPLTEADIQVAEFPAGADWVVYRVWAQAAGNISVEGWGEFQMRESILSGGKVTEPTVPICMSQPASAGVFTGLFVGSDFEARGPLSGVSLRVAYPTGLELSASASSLIQLEDSDSSGAHFFFFGLGDRSARLAEGARMQWYVEVLDGNFTWEMYAHGPMSCTGSLQDFRGDFLQTPLLTEARDLARPAGSSKTSFAWLMGKANLELKLAIRQGPNILAAGERVIDETQLHLMRYRIPPGSLDLEVPLLRHAGTERPWVHSVVLGEIPSDASDWWFRQAVAVGAAKPTDG